MNPPHLTFFCELDAQALQSLFGKSVRPQLIEMLRGLDARISLGILDFSPERAEVVRQLNQAGIPVIAWLLLPAKQGYWFNLDNSVHAFQCYESFLAWTAEHHLHWTGIGLDIEPNIALVQEFMRFPASRARLMWKLFWRTFDFRRLRQARKTYCTLVARMHADGYLVESYQFPLVIDERKARSTFLQRFLGTFDIPVDKEVLMVYSSFVRPHGSGLIWSYGPEAQGIALGSTGGGVDFGLGENQPGLAPLSWKELSRDMRLAWVYASDIYIFSLEGCVQQGFLQLLTNFAWDQPIFEPLEPAARVDAWRKALSSALWIFAHPWVMALAISGGFLLLRRLCRRGK